MLNKKIDLIKLFLILVCILPIGFFVFNLLNNYMTLFKNVISSSVFLLGGLGLLIYYNGFKIPGIIFIILSFTGFIVKGIVFEQNILKTYYFWIFAVGLAYFIFKDFISKGKEDNK